jgi:hypothetical protein
MPWIKPETSPNKFIGCYSDLTLTGFNLCTGYDRSGIDRFLVVTVMRMILYAIFGRYTKILKLNLALISILLLVLTGYIDAQTFTDSNLPIVIINTDGSVPIVDNPRALASMKIIYRGPGERNYLTDQDNPQYLNYTGRIDIEIRGSSSQVTDKKQYGFSTLMADNVSKNNVSLLGMPDEHDWIFNGMVFDPAMMRDYLCYNLSRQIGEYASRTAYCELVINRQFMGLYLLQEKIKADNNRVNIVKIDVNDNSLPQLSGGYITKADKTTGGDPIAWKMTNLNGTTVDYIHEFPKPEYVTSFQNTYIQTQFIKLAEAAKKNNTSLIDGYPSIIDIPSFIDYIIISELSSNADSYQYSTYFHKDRNGKLRAGPIWDNDLTFSNDLFFWGYDRSKTNVWQFSNGDNEGSDFWKDFYSDMQFKCYLSKRWNELIQPGMPLNRSVLESFIDQTAAYINEAVQRNNIRWINTGNFQESVSTIKTFLDSRIPWITGNIGSYAFCSNVGVPPLVITAIMYHPSTTLEFPDENDLEYLEITNHGDQEISLTGVYFAGSGITYQFPPNSTIAANSSIFLAANQQSFRLKYGFSPFGRFTEQLSNNGENIILADGFGNIIDNVNYTDTVPWPEADGNGYYLKLLNPDLDNNDPASWIASNDVITSTGETVSDGSLKIYPNPVSEILTINSDFEIKTVFLADMFGRLIVKTYPDSQSYELNVSGLPSGIYILRIEGTNKTFIRKVIKE